MFTFSQCILHNSFFTIAHHKELIINFLNATLILHFLCCLFYFSSYSMDHWEFLRSGLTLIINESRFSPREVLVGIENLIKFASRLWLFRRTEMRQRTLHNFIVRHQIVCLTSHYQAILDTTKLILVSLIFKVKRGLFAYKRRRQLVDRAQHPNV